MPPRRSLPPWVVGALVVTATAAALTPSCRQETILLAPRADTTHTGGTGGGTVQRVPLTLTIKLFPNDTGMGTALGWPSGVVPGAAVTLQRDGSSDTALHAVSDSLGVVAFAAVLTGSYSISAVRVVDSTERPRLPAGYTDVDALGSGSRIGVDTPGVVTDLTIPVSHRGSLVVSEWWYPADASTTPDAFYPFAGYVELYNNSDTVIYLDGKIFGDAGLQLVDSPQHPCNQVSSYVTDSAGLWSFELYEFPGAGTDHPVAPGQAVVLATDAVDHTQVNPQATDLSNADFEFIGSADVDNPAVPNMINLVAFDPPLGHGYKADVVFSIPFVANHADLDTLPVAYPFNNYPFYRIPRAAVLDVATLWWPGVADRYAVCDHLISPVFDGQPGALIPGADFYTSSLQRKVSRMVAGRTILQRTKTTAADFQLLFPRTPGSVP